MKELFNLLQSVVQAYISPSQGLAFAVFHLLLLIGYFRIRWTILREARVLREWRPGTEGKSQCTNALNYFLKDSEQIAAQGLLAPLTDFTDRLDSIVEGQLGRLHDRINLFLVVGIAGTVFGMYDFVSRAGSGTNLAEHIGKYLAEALGKALPVAFMGLILYVLGFIFASYPEQQLRDALARATENTLNYRRRLVSKSIIQSIQESLEPLKDLRSTLTDVIQPVITEWAAHLEETYKIVRVQMEALGHAVDGVGMGVDAVKSSTNELRAVAEGLSSLLSGIPKTLEKVDDSYDRQIKRLEELSQTIESTHVAASTAISEFQTVNQHISETLKLFEALPEELRQSVVGSLASLGEKLPPIWQSATDDLREKVVNIVSAVKSETAGPFTEIKQAAEKWNELGNSARRLMSDSFDEAMKKVLETATRDLPRVEEVFANRFPKAISEVDTVAAKMKEMAAQWQSLIVSLGTLNDQLAQLLERIKNAKPTEASADRVDEIAREIRRCGDGITKAYHTMGDGGKRTIMNLLEEMHVGIEELHAEFNRRRRFWPPAEWFHVRRKD